MIFLSPHIKVAMSPYWRQSLFQTPELGCGAIRSHESLAEALPGVFIGTYLHAGD